VIEKVFVPDISGAENVEVIEVMVSPGDRVEVEDPLITLEGDKASMEVPSPMAGVVDSLAVSVGDKVSEGSLILSLQCNGDKTAVKKKPLTEKEESKSSSGTQVTAAEEKKSLEREEKGKGKEKRKAESKQVAVETPEKETSEPSPRADDKGLLSETSMAEIHAGPGVRRIAREFGVPLEKVTATGSKNRILKEDVQHYVKLRLSASESSSFGLGLLPPLPDIDFSRFGPVEIKPLSKIKKLTGQNLSRNWLSIPHVTQFDEADITELENFRQEQKVLAEKKNIRLTPLVFIMKAVVSALRKFPQFNASLEATGQSLIYKNYFNIGVAVDTPNGLVVPVIREVDRKGMFDLAKELGEISGKAREKGLSVADMQGGCFTISSLGGIGGTAFTPIINAPEVAILGVSKAARKPVISSAGEVVPRFMLPLSLSYDHRVIDGAEAARFIVFLSNCLSDIRHILL